MSLKDKIINVITAHPKIVPKIAIFGIGLAITFVVGVTIGILDHNQAFAINFQHQQNSGSNALGIHHKTH